MDVQFNISLSTKGEMRGFPDSRMRVISDRLGMISVRHYLDRDG